MEDEAVGHNFERNPPRDHPSGPPFKMAAVTEKKNFFNCPLLLKYKPK
jgi:hypothetical protein